MRAYEFLAGEIVGNPGRRLIVDLDFLVSLSETPYEGRPSWGVTFSGGGAVLLTKPAFDRILLAWKSN
jgi:hypothetical protein